MKLKALVFDPYCPYPPQTGTHQSELAILRALASIGYELHVFGTSVSTDIPWSKEAVDYLSTEFGVQVYYYGGDWLDALYTARQGGKAPNSWSRFNSPWLLDTFRDLFQKIQPDLVVVHYAWWGRLALGDEYRSAIRVIVSHDSLTLNEHMQARIAPYLKVPVEPAAVNPAALSEDFYSDIDLSTLLAGAEEYAIYDNYDVTVAFSSLDAKLVQSHTSQTLVEEIPITYDVVNVDNTYDSAPVLVVSDYCLNIQGYAYFAANVLPAVRAACPEFVLQVIGRACDKIVPVAGVELVGYVAELSDVYTRSRFAICPVIGGTGMQVKILESMAYGVPVIALRNVADQSPIEHGKNGLIASNAQEFARLVVELWRDPERCKTLGAAARETIQQNFCADVQASRWQQVLDAAQTRRGACPARQHTDVEYLPADRGNSTQIGLQPHDDRTAPGQADGVYMREAVESTRRRGLSECGAKISIITPALNCAAYIRQCIDSVLAQGYDNFEHIVVDGGSDDQTLDILRDYPHVRWISESDRGEPDALNKALEMASGDIIGWLNADDFYLEGALATAAEALDPGAGIHLIYGNVILLGEDDHPIGIRVPPPTMDLQRLLRWHRPLHIFQPAMFFTTELVRAVGRFREDLPYAVDLDFWVRAALAGYQFCNVDQTFAKMRLLRADGKSVTPYARKDQDWLAACLPAVANLSDVQQTHFWKDYYVHRLVNDHLYGGESLRLPDSRSATLGLALATIDANAAQDGAAYLEKAVELHPDCQDLYWLLGEALNQIGEHSRAEQMFAAGDRVRLRGVGVKPAIQRAPSRVDDAAITVTDMEARRKQKIDIGINVIGYVSGNLGVGVTARSVVQVLLDQGCSVAVYDVDPGAGRGKFDRCFDRYCVDAVTDLPHAINLFVFPLADLSGFISKHPEIIKNSTRLSACWCVWELAVLPRGWSDALQSMDVLIAQSDFIRHALAFSVSGVPVLSAKHPLPGQGTSSPQRDRFGLPDKATIFISSFDLNSDPERKNPTATLAAFQHAFAGDQSAHLVIKLNGTSGTGERRAWVKDLRDYCGARANVQLITDTLSYSDVLSLYASCDVFVSLHRAEGFGLGMMEAMALGKPVIATGWSGNMSFMDHTNACLVNYRLVPVQASINAYSRERVGADAVWADADIEQAANWMYRLASDPALRASIGEAACQAIAKYQSDAQRADFVSELAAIATQRAVRRPPTPHADELEVEHELSDNVTVEPYSEWIRYRGHRADAERAHAQEMIEGLVHEPTIHVIVVVDDESIEHLAKTIDSMSAQLYGGWGLTVVSAMACPNPVFEELDMLEWLHADREIAAAINTAVAATAADWVTLLEPGDQLDAGALLSCAKFAERNPSIGFVYTDEDTVDVDGARSHPRFKPDFNLELLRSCAYVGSFCLVKGTVLEAIAGVVSLGSLANHDLCLRVVETFGGEAVGHIADVLVHQLDVNTRRREVTSDQGATLVEGHLNRAGVDAKVEPGLVTGSFLVDYQHSAQPLVSIVVPTRNRRDVLEPCLESLLHKTGYKNFEVIVVDNQTDDQQTLCYLDEVAQRHKRVTVVRYDHPFNYSAINNVAASQASGDYLLLLNNDTLIVQLNWLDRLMSQAQQPDVGAVGPRLVFPDQRIQHAGVVLGMGQNGVAEHPFFGAPMSVAGPMNLAQSPRDVSALTGACLLIRKSIYQQVGGMDEDKLAVMYNDVDLCLKVREQGFRVVWTPYATAVHHGSASLKDGHYQDAKKWQQAKNEVAVMLDRWLPKLARDPAYNRNLNLMRTDYSVDTEMCAQWDDGADGPRILGMSLGSSGSRQHRLDIPMNALRRARRATTHLLPECIERVRVPSVSELAREAPDILLAHNTLHDVQLEALERYRRFNKDVLLAFGQDDLIDHLPSYNSFSKTVYPDIKKRLRRAMNACHRLVVSTEPLAQAYRGWSDDIVVVPNYLDGSIWKALKSRRGRGDKPRVGWAGAQQHSGDLDVIHEVVKKTAGEVQWVFFGLCFEEWLSLGVEVHNPVVFEQYPNTLAALDLDLAVAPLAYNRFNQCKSNLKLLEYGALGWPVVCSDIEPYRDAPVARVPNTPAAWINTIREHVDDLDASRREGDALRAWIHEHWMLDDHLDEWLRVLSAEGTGTDVRAVGGK